MKLRPMRTLVCLLLIPLISLAFADTLDIEQPATRATKILVNQNGFLMPIIGATKKQALIELNGEKTPVLDKNTFIFEREDQFAPGSIIISDPYAEYEFLMPPVSKMMNMGSLFIAKLTPSISYKNCYVVLVLYDRQFIEGTNPDPIAGFYFRNIGELKANKRKSIRVDLNSSDIPTSAMHRVHYFFMLFADGQEIKTNNREIPEIFFRRLELRNHKIVVQRYCADHQNGDFAIRRYVDPKPVLPKMIGEKDLPESILVTFSVTSSGIVEGVRWDHKTPNEASRSIDKTLSEWLFIPQIKNGLPVSAEVEVPIMLKQ